MKNIFKKSIIISVIIAISFTSCTDDRVLVASPDFFQVNVTDYQKLLTDTIVVNVNQDITFNFPKGCTDEILFFSGEPKKEYRFSNREGLYRQSDSTLFESKLIINTTVSNFDAAIPKSYTLISISGLGGASVNEFKASAKTVIKNLRATSTSVAAFADTILINKTSTPLNIFSGDFNFAIQAQSANSTKNLLSVSGFSITNTETRDYSFSKNGLVVTNKQLISYPVIASFNDASWAQYAPDSTIAPGTTTKVVNATGCSWNTGEIGVSYAPIVTGGTVSKNKNGQTLATAYPISVVDTSKVNPAISLPSEAWIICKPVNLTNAVLSSTTFSDTPITVKSLEKSSVKYYRSSYTTRGMYRATFVGLNIGTNGTARVIREFVIIVKNNTDNL